MNHYRLPSATEIRSLLIWFLVDEGSKRYRLHCDDGFNAIQHTTTITTIPITNGTDVRPALICSFAIFFITNGSRIFGDGGPQPWAATFGSAVHFTIGVIFIEFIIISPAQWKLLP